MAMKADSLSSPGSPVSPRDDPGLWMTLDLHPDPRPPRPTSAQTQGSDPGAGAASGAAGAEAQLYVFLPPSRRCTAPPPPPGGEATPPTHTPAHDPCVSCPAGGTGEVTQAKGNPAGLGRRPAERQTVAEHSEVTDEETGSERERNRDPEDQQQPGDMETETACEEKDANTAQHIESPIMAGGVETLAQTSSEASAQPRSPDMSKDPEEGSGSHSGRMGVTISTEEYKASTCPPSDLEGGRGEEESGTLLPSGHNKSLPPEIKSPGESEDASSVSAGTNSLGPTNGGIAGHDCSASDVTDLTDIESAQEGNRHPENTMEVPDIVEPPDSDTVKEQSGVRRQSDNLPSLSTHLTSVESPADQHTELLLPTPELGRRQSQSDGGEAISYVIQQGELLLQRLQCVQERQDTQPPTTPPAGVPANQTADEGEEGELESGVAWSEGQSLGAGVEGGAYEAELRVEHRSTLVGEDEEYGRTEAQGEIERTEEGDIEEGLAAIPVDPTLAPRPHLGVPRLENIPSDHQSDTGVTADVSPTHAQEAPTPTETPVVEINPDVLEIPFKTPILLKELQGGETGTARCLTRQFSEKKMQKEISQERQRELVLVNQGTIPGEYRKEGTRQLKETKKLFEGLLQGSGEGAVRLSKTTFTDPVYPSVLERTRSMEMLSLRGQPVCRTQSLRVPRSEATNGGWRRERCRSRSPVAGPYRRLEHNLRHHRSMDSLSVEALASKQGSRNKAKKLEPFLGANPFVKLRPALARQPEVQKDIRESREREEELRRQRCALYGESFKPQEDEDSAAPTDSSTAADPRQQSKGKLDRIWPPPPRAGGPSSGQTQGPRASRPGGHVTGLSQRWEAASRPSTDQS
ncbi:unnamed protein product [Arctogadus glacialis]